MAVLPVTMRLSPYWPAGKWDCHIFFPHVMLSSLSLLRYNNQHYNYRSCYFSKLILLCIQLPDSRVIAGLNITTAATFQEYFATTSINTFRTNFAQGKVIHLYSVVGEHGHLYNLIDIVGWCGVQDFSTGYGLYNLRWVHSRKISPVGGIYHFERFCNPTWSVFVQCL